MMNIRNFAVGSALLCALAAVGAAPASPVISAVDMARSENDPNSLYLSYTIAAESWKIPSNTEVKITPVLKYQGGELELQPVIYAGRNAYLAHKRNHNTPNGALLMRAKGNDRQFTEVIPWNDAYSQSELTFRSETIGCRCKGEGIPSTLPVSLAMDFSPKEFEVITPVAELMAMEKAPEKVVKTRNITRSAYVNYKINSPVLIPDYKSNPIELANIVATIDSVRADKDLTVDKVTIHGFASPDGPYENNKKLAAARTEALRKYVDNHYGFGNQLTATSTPEDWAGLRVWVADSQLAGKAGILEIIDSNLAPDEKELKIKKQFPASYRVMLEQVYPSLRRADYNIEYVVRTFTEPATISQLLQTDPSKLSYEELMLLARNYPEGTAKRNELILKAAEIFPNDERAQLSAAFIMLDRRELKAAEGMLKRAGNSAVADYARGILALYQKDNAKAAQLLGKAAKAKITGASEALIFAQR